MSIAPTPHSLVFGTRRHLLHPLFYFQSPNGEEVRSINEVLAVLAGVVVLIFWQLRKGERAGSRVFAVLAWLRRSVGTGPTLKLLWRHEHRRASKRGRVD